MVDEGWAKANRAALVGYLRALRKGTEYMSPIPTNPRRWRRQDCAPLSLRAPCIETTAKMDIMSRDLSVAPASLRRVFASCSRTAPYGSDLASSRRNSWTKLP